MLGILLLMVSFYFFHSQTQKLELHVQSFSIYNNKYYRKVLAIDFIVIFGNLFLVSHTLGLVFGKPPLWFKYMKFIYSLFKKSGIRSF